MAVSINADAPPTPRRDICVAMVRQALNDSRPVGEEWVVVIAEPDDDVTRFEFRLGTEAPRSITLAVQDDAASRALLYGSICRFLRRAWTGALAEH